VVELLKTLINILTTLIALILEVIQLTPKILSFNSEVFRAALDNGFSVVVAGAIVYLGGASLTFGRSVVMSINKIANRNFILGILFSMLSYVVGWLLWVITIWLVATYFFNLTDPIWVVTRIVGLAYAPLMLGFLILIPYLGPFLSTILHFWSFMLILAGVQFVYGFELWQALVCSASGWIIVQALNRTVASYFLTLDRWLNKKIFDSPLNREIEQAIIKFNQNVANGFGRNKG